MKKVFFIDIDGTILDTSPDVSSFNIEAINAARKNGCKVFLNTGRGMACIPNNVMNLPLDGVVSGCGCTITYNGQKIYSDCPPVSVVYSYLNGIFERGEHCFLEGEEHLFRCNCEKHFETNEAEYAKYCRDARLDYSIWKPLSSPEQILSYPEARIPKLNLAGRHSADDIKRFSQHYDGVSDSTKCEMFTKGNSKATAMTYLMKNYFPEYKSVAIGDGVNDAEMLKAADISVAMGNAPQSLKDICHIVTDTCDNNGMGKAILELIQ